MNHTDQFRTLLRGILVETAADLDPQRSSEYLRGMVELISNATATSEEIKDDMLGNGTLRKAIEASILPTDPTNNRLDTTMIDNTWYDDTIDMGDYGYALLNTNDEGDHSLHFTDYLESALDVFDEDEKNILFDEDGWLTSEAESLILGYVRGILPDHYDVELGYYGGDDPHITFDVHYKEVTAPSTVYDDYYPAYAILHNATDDYRMYRYALTALGA